MLNTFPHQLWISCKWYDSFLCPSTFIPYCHCLLFLKGRCKEDGARLLSVAQCQDQKRRAQSETQEAPSEHQGTLFPVRGHSSGTGHQRGCAVSILRDLQNLSGASPGQPGLGDPAWAWGLGQVTSRGSFQHILRFCFTDPRNSPNTVCMSMNVPWLIGQWYWNNEAAADESHIKRPEWGLSALYSNLSPWAPLLEQIRLRAELKETLIYTGLLVCQ